MTCLSQISGSVLGIDGGVPNHREYSPVSNSAQTGPYIGAVE